MTVMRDNLSFIKELSLYRCGENNFRGDDIWDMKTLETLIIMECQTIDVERGQQFIRNLIALRHVNFMGCSWVND